MTVSVLQDGEVIEGDCMEIMKTFEAGSFDAVITSPPFRDADVEGKYYSWFVPFVSECSRIARDYALIFNSSRRLKYIDRLTDPIRHIVWNKGAGRTPYRFEIIFVYSGHTPSYNFNAVCWTDCISAQPILRFETGATNAGHTYDIHSKKTLRGSRAFDLNSNNKQESYVVIDGRHPYENPVEIVEPLVRFLKKGGSKRILDPCAGSGTTLVACAKQGIAGYGIEKVSEYAKLARKRVRDYLGQERLD